jgi:hypothetical protein
VRVIRDDLARQPLAEGFAVDPLNERLDAFVEGGILQRAGVAALDEEVMVSDTEQQLAGGNHASKTRMARTTDVMATHGTSRCSPAERWLPSSSVTFL